MRTQVLATAAVAAALTTAAAPMPAAAQGMGLGSIFSCQGQNGTTGTVLGGVLGALAGSQISKNERTLGAVAGAAVGAWAGNQLACKMNSSSRVEAQNAFERTLNTGRAQNWYDSRTGATGRIEVVSDSYAGGYAPYAGQYNRNVSATDLRYARGVQRIYTGFQPTSDAFVAPGRVNLRAAPTSTAPVIDRLGAGARFNAAGMVNGSWIAVEEDGWVRGYVAASAVRPVGGMTYASNSGCRVVQQTITVRGYRDEVQRFNACRDRGGQWRLDPI